MFVVGTAGHVNHGKTSLVRALTGVDTDRLEEEKRRGMTIELGFAPIDLGGGKRGSIVDVPGHRRFVPTMIAGASGIDVVLFVVAADEGVMPQTREHLAVCELLGLSRGVVALTKIDRVDEETQALATAGIEALLAGKMDAAIIPCSTKSGLGIEALKVALGGALLARTTTDARPKLWIDRVLQVNGAGTVVTGTLVAGKLREQDEVFVSGRARTTSVRALHVHGARVEEATAPTRLAINLPLDAADIGRGDLITAEAVPLTSQIDVSVRGGAFRRGAEVTLHVGTCAAGATVARVDRLDEHTELVRLTLDRALPIRAGERHLVRGGASLGGGIVLDARPAKLKPATRRQLAAAIHAHDASAAMSVLVDALAPRPVVPAEWALAVPLAGGDLVACGAGFIRRATLRELAVKARLLVTEHHARAPLDRGLPLASLRAELARAAGPDAADAAILLARAPTDGAIAIAGDVAVAAARTNKAPPELARVRDRLATSGVHGLSSGVLTEELKLAPPIAKSVLAALERDGVAVRAGELWFARSIVDGVRQRVVAQLASGGSLTVIAAKNLCGLPRRQTILLLEHFDATGVTRRVGDARVLS